MMLNVVGRVRLCLLHRSTLRDWLAFLKERPAQHHHPACKPDHALNSSKRVNISKLFDAADCADAFLKPSGYSVFSVLLIVIMLIP